jgi:hypothetical protein
MNSYNALLAAADHIERFPEEFYFDAVNVPEAVHCGSPGCAIGWTAFFAGVIQFTPQERLRLTVVCQHALGVSEDEFYKRMNYISTDEWHGVISWRTHAGECARCLRVYAERYLADQKPRLRTDAELVAALMHKVSTERVAEDASA